MISKLMKFMCKSSAFNNRVEWYDAEFQAKWSTLKGPSRPASREANLISDSQSGNESPVLPRIDRVNLDQASLESSLNSVVRDIVTPRSLRQTFKNSINNI